MSQNPVDIMVIFDRIARVGVIFGADYLQGFTIVMKHFKKTITSVAMLAGLAMAPCVAQATLVTYNWTPDSAVNGVTSTGTLVYNTTGNDITSFSFTYGSDKTDTSFVAGWFFGTFQLKNGDLALNGFSTDQSYNPVILWDSTFSPPPDENSATPLFCGTVFGDWVQAPGGSGQGNGRGVVPEPKTILSGALLLLPLGMGVIRGMRKQRTA
jgi:hypothetical protein